MGSPAKDSLTQDARLQFTPAVFENPLLAMVTMVTIVTIVTRVDVVIVYYGIAPPTTNWNRSGQTGSS